MHQSNCPRLSNRPAHRRGIAIMQVMFALGSATILTSAYMASRDNSVIIADNVASAAESRAAAESGLELGRAMLETMADWRVNHTDGVLLDGYAFGNVSLDLKAYDLLTMQPPTAESTEIGLRCTATVDGVAQTVSAVATVLTAEETIAGAVDLAEFAVFGAEQINMSDNATIARWPMAPLTREGRRIALGTQGTMVGTVNLATNAAAIDSTLYHGPGASPLVILNASGPAIQKVGLLDNIPLPNAPACGVADPGGTIASPYTQSAGSATIKKNARYGSFNVDAGGLVGVSGPLDLVIDGDLHMVNDSQIKIHGDVRLIVFGSVTLDDSDIELTDGAALEMWIGGALSMSDAYIGDGRGDDLRDTSGTADYADPTRVRLYDMGAADAWELTAQSLVKASVYVPTSTFSVLGNSALYGRVAARRFIISGNGVVFYDHTLDPLNGYTNATSVVYEDDNTIDAAVLAMPSLSPGDLLTAAIAGAQNLWAEGILYDAGVVGDDLDNTIPPITEPTPRIVSVQYEVVAYGANTETWEDDDAPRSANLAESTDNLIVQFK